MPSIYARIIAGWRRSFGYALFIGMMATGYYYNVTFVQLGLLDLGERVIGLDRPTVALSVAGLAVLTALVSLGSGLLLVRSGLSSCFEAKLRLALGVVLAQTVLTATAPWLRSLQGYLLWIALASVALGLGVPATFGLAVDLVPRRHRGYVAGIITAVAYFAAPVFSYPWQIEILSRQMLLIMVPGAVAIGWLALVASPLRARLATQHTLREFAYGRFVVPAKGRLEGISPYVAGLVALMFAVFFVDSLGFVRITHSPFLIEHAWRSPELGPRLLIGMVHVVAALTGGILYAALDERSLFAWVLAIFALVHLSYTFPIRLAPLSSQTLAEPMLYAIAVSLYTMLNFALWADVSTPATIARNAALGVSASAWSATFISTALAIQMENAGVPVMTHLQIVDALAVVLFLALLLLSYFEGGSRRPRWTGEPS